MADKNSRNQLPSPEGGVFYNIAFNIKLIIRLMKDPRINFFLKLLPFAPFIYFIAPDLVPGPFEDALFLWLGAYLFIELCPQEIVDEHRLELLQVVNSSWRDVDEDEIVDVEILEMDQDENGQNNG